MPLNIEARRVGAYDEKAASDEAGLSFEGQVSRTVQSHAKGTDVNEIVRQFKVTGVVPQGVRRPTYGDFDHIGDYRDAMDAMLVAQKAFMAMPAKVRERFNNDPAEFVAFCSDDANLDEMRKLGLAVPAAPKPAPLEVTVIPTGTPAPAPGVSS